MKASVGSKNFLLVWPFEFYSKISNTPYSTAVSLTTPPVKRLPISNFLGETTLWSPSFTSIEHKNLHFVACYLHVPTTSSRHCL